MLISSTAASVGAGRPPAAKFDRGAWAVLVIALLVTAVNATTAVLPLLLPGDGWSYSELDPDLSAPDWVAVQSLSSAPTPLQAGDQVLAIEGVPVGTRMARAFALQVERPAGWAAGGRAEYQVLRAGQTLVLDVPLRRLTAAEVLDFFAPHEVDFLLSMVGPLTLVIALIVFWQRPQLAATRVMLLFGAALASGYLEAPDMAAALLYRGVLVLPFLLSTWAFALLPSLLHLLLVFPVVKRPLRQWPRLTLALLYGSAQGIIWLVWLLNWGRPAAVTFWHSAVVVVSAVGLLVAMIVSLVHSWITVRGPVARAQMGWMNIGLVVGFMGSSLLWLVATFFPTFNTVWKAAALSLQLAVPVSLAITTRQRRGQAGPRQMTGHGAWR